MARTIKRTTLRHIKKVQDEWHEVIDLMTFFRNLQSDVIIDVLCGSGTHADQFETKQDNGARADRTISDLLNPMMKAMLKDTQLVTKLKWILSKSNS